MRKYCTKCGSELHTGARFCAKCGAAVLSAPANSVPGAQPEYVPQPHTNNEAQPQYRTTAQPQYYTPPVTMPGKRNAAKPKSKSGRNTLCIVLSVLLVIQTVVVALYGWPGLLAGGKDMAAETEKTTVSMDNPSVTLAEVRIDANTLNLMDGEKELTVSRKTQSVDETTGLMTMEYDIALEDMHLLYAPLTLTVPYDMAAAAGGDVVIEHYSSDYGMWIPQITVDNGDGTVTASLTSLSPVKLVYLGRDYPEGVFYISERDSNYAKMMVNHQYWNIIKNMPRDMHNQS